MTKTQPHIRFNPLLGFWVCSSDHHGRKGLRRIQGIEKTAVAAYARWKENILWENNLGEWK